MTVEFLIRLDISFRRKVTRLFLNFKGKNQKNDGTSVATGKKKDLKGHTDSL